MKNEYDIVDLYEVIDFFVNHFDPTESNAKALWSFVQGQCDHSILNDEWKMAKGVREMFRSKCVLCGEVFG